MLLKPKIKINKKVFASDILDTLYAEDKKRNSASALCRQDELLIKGWAMRQGYHKGKGTLTAKEANIERQIMDGYFKSRIDSENAIK